MKYLLSAAALGVAALQLFAPSVRADPAESASAAKVPVARRLYDEGVEAASKEQWPLAYDHFKASYELEPRILTLYNLAAAQAQTGRPVEASESYRKFLRDTGDGRYPELHTSAQAQLDSVAHQIAQTSFDIAPIAPGDRVTIDDAEFPSSVLHESIPLDPGAHTAIVHRGDAKLVSLAFTLTPGANDPIHIVVPKPPPRRVDLVIHPAPLSPPGAPGTTFDHPAPPPSRHPILYSPWLWSAAAVVVAGSVATTYFLTRSNTETLVVR